MPLSPPSIRLLARLARVVLCAAVAIAALAWPATAGAASSQLHGAMTHSMWNGSNKAVYDREFDMLQDAGANAVRIDLSWSSLETDRKGQYSQWFIDKTDSVIQDARARGLNVIANLWSTPCWASTAPTDLRQSCVGAWWDRGVDRYSPSNPADYADAVAFVARRWGSQLAALEIWNEPNLPDQGFLRSPDPAADYAAMLKAAYPAAKAASPGLTVLGGALAFSDGEFLERLYDEGIKDHFDGISIHPYNEWRDPEDSWKPEWRKYTFLTGVPWIHDIMARHGDGDKGLWLTEFGFSTCGSGDRWCVSAEKQATYVDHSFAIARKWGYVKAAILYNLRNKGTDPTDRESQFGILDRDFSPKPAWAAFKGAMAAYGGDEAQEPTAPTAAPVAAPDLASAPLPVIEGPGTITATPSGKAPVTVTCPAGERACAGEVTLTTRVPPRRRGRGAKSRQVRLGGRQVRVRPGGRKTVHVRIPRHLRPLVARRSRLHLVVRMAGKDARGQSRNRSSRKTLRTERLRAAMRR
ncbi:MAG TPA: cellulase family glycosylhydrolase [Thermoleophilaceae bacterium]